MDETACQFLQLYTDKTFCLEHIKTRCFLRYIYSLKGLLNNLKLYQARMIHRCLIQCLTELQNKPVSPSIVECLRFMHYSFTCKCFLIWHNRKPIGRSNRLSIRRYVYLKYLEYHLRQLSSHRKRWWLVTLIRQCIKWFKVCQTNINCIFINGLKMCVKCACNTHCNFFC